MAGAGCSLSDRKALEKCGEIITLLRSENVDIKTIDSEICELYNFLLHQTRAREMRNEKRRERRKSKKEGMKSEPQHDDNLMDMDGPFQF